MSFKGWPSLVWHAPGKAWGGMLRAGSLATWMQFGAGVAATSVAVGIALIVWLGPWPDSAAAQRLALLGQGQVMAWVTILVALAAIAGLRLAFSANKDGFRGGVERDDDDAPTVKVETVTTTSIAEKP